MVLGKGGNHGGQDLMSVLKHFLKEKVGSGKGFGKSKSKSFEGGGGADEDGGSIGEFVGTIKSFNENSGYGFIDCPGVRKLGHNGDVFLHHLQLKGYQVGHKVRFTGYITSKGTPQAKNLRSGLKEEPDQGHVGGGVDAEGGDIGEFVGTIKNFNESSGYGFIECQEIRDMGHDGDVFLHHAQKKNYQIGHQVKFTAYLTSKGKPQAKNLMSGLKRAASQIRISPILAQNQPKMQKGMDQTGGELGQFLGVIKSFNENSGYGFIQCDALQAAGAAGDVFLHHLQKRNYQIGHTVKFTAYTNSKGQPQAKDLQSGLK